MILRKPYAFFIKHFRLFHMIMEVLILLSISKTKSLLNFFNEYINTLINIIGQDFSSVYVSTSFILLPIFIILISLIILVVMIVKKKPKLFYIVNIAIYIFTLIVILVSRNILETMSTRTLDIRVVMLIRDLNSLIFILQLLSSIVVLIRAVGFDIKKFDFRTDLKDIQIEEEDREEFEVNIEFDKNNLIRKFRQKLRYFKYSFKENKLLFLLGGIGILIGVSVLMISYFKNIEIIYKQDKLFEGDNFSMQVTDSYIVNTDYRGNLINNDCYYVILKTKIKNNTSYDFGLDIASAKLLIGNFIYTPTVNNKSKFFDFGRVYQGENIGQEFEDKVFVYEIPKQLAKDEMIFNFGDKNNNHSYGDEAKIKIKIEYTDLTVLDSSEIVNLNTKLQLSGSVLNNYIIEINAFDIQKQYKLKYDFCIKNECYESYEYLNPSITSNYDKSILKINGSLIEGDDDLDEIENLYDFIESFGTLSYTINGEKKQQTVRFKQVKSKKVKSRNTYYIEVLDEVLNASNISIMFTVRNKNYEYVLK